MSASPSSFRSGRLRLLDKPPRPRGVQRFLVIGHGRAGSDGAAREELDYLRSAAEQNLIAHGPTFSEQSHWNGSVTLLETSISRPPTFPTTRSLGCGLHIP